LAAVPEQPFISICIPTYKNAAYVERLLNSIVQQSYRDFEIVVTDNSPDNSVEKLVQQFSDRLPIRYYKNEPPTGMAENFNEGLKKAGGTWIKPMHDDDWFASPASLERFAVAAMQTTSKFIFSACKNVYAQSGKIVDEMLAGSRKEMLEENHVSLFHLNVIGHPSVVMHYNDSGLLYDTSFNWVVDVDFYMRFLSSHPGFEYIPDFLVNIGIDENQLSNKYYKNPRVEVPEYLRMLAKFPPGLASGNQYVFHMLWDLVRKFRLKGAADIERCGYDGAVPGVMPGIIRYQQNIPRIILKQPSWSKRLMKRCFRQLNKAAR
jgi:glycosyltransferase involved in cell wall biosynthesis